MILADHLGEFRFFGVSYFILHDPHKQIALPLHRGTAGKGLHEAFRVTGEELLIFPLFP
jgi:hypothetical protein